MGIFFSFLKRSLPRAAIHASISEVSSRVASNAKAPLPRSVIFYVRLKGVSVKYCFKYLSVELKERRTFPPLLKLKCRDFT